MAGELTTYLVGPLDGPMYLPWNSDPKPVPDDGRVRTALGVLVKDWPSIVGDLSLITEPLRSHRQEEAEVSG
jgi:hypothetical protein